MTFWFLQVFFSCYCLIVTCNFSVQGSTTLGLPLCNPLRNWKLSEMRAIVYLSFCIISIVFSEKKKKPKKQQQQQRKKTTATKSYFRGKSTYHIVDWIVRALLGANFCDEVTCPSDTLLCNELSSLEADFHPSMQGFTFLRKK